MKAVQRKIIPANMDFFHVPIALYHYEKWATENIPIYGRPHTLESVGLVYAKRNGSRLFIGSYLGQVSWRLVDNYSAFCTSKGLNQCLRQNIFVSFFSLSFPLIILKI